MIIRVKHVFVFVFVCLDEYVHFSLLPATALRAKQYKSLLEKIKYSKLT